LAGDVRHDGVMDVPGSARVLARPAEVHRAIAIVPGLGSRSAQNAHQEPWRANRKSQREVGLRPGIWVLGFPCQLAATTGSFVGDIAGVVIVGLIGTAQILIDEVAVGSALTSFGLLRRLFHVVAVDVVEREAHATLRYE
jgi:hypothetical protein